MNSLPVKKKKPSSKIVSKPNRKIDLAEALRLKFRNNLSNAEIGRMFGVTGNAVGQALKGIIANIGNPELAKAYEERKVDILAAGERVLFSALMDPEKINAASLNNIAYTIKTVHEMGRLERGAATEIVDVTALTASISVRKKRIEAMEAELGPEVVDIPTVK